MKQKIHKCPACHEETSKVRDYRIQNVKDIPILGMYSILKIHKRRYVCKSCGKKVYENTPFLPKYQRTSSNCPIHSNSSSNNQEQRHSWFVMYYNL